jgi:hypothetical protein
MSCTDILTCACSNLGLHFTILLTLLWSTVTVNCPLCICISLFMYITEVTGPLKCHCLSGENIGSEPHLDQDLKEKLLDEEPSV